MNNKKNFPTIRSSAAEYLSFVAATGNAQTSVEMRYENENIWLTQKMMATLYDVSVSAINQHLKRIYADNELTREETIKNYLTVQMEGNREVKLRQQRYEYYRDLLLSSCVITLSSCAKSQDPEEITIRPCDFAQGDGSGKLQGGGGSKTQGDEVKAWFVQNNKEIK